MAAKKYVEHVRWEQRQEAIKLRNEIIAAGGNWEDADENLVHLDAASRQYYREYQEQSGNENRRPFASAGH